jgi:iron complex transport system substrate-binding protein
MRRFATVLIGLMWSMAHALTFIDDAGRSVVLERPAQRIITLAPNLTELVYAVNGGEAMIATVALSDFPEAAKTLPRIGDHERLDVERVVTLRPDLLLAWQHGNASRELAQLEAAGLPVYYLEPKRLDDVPRALERVGELLGHEAQGRASAQALRNELAALRQRHSGAAPVTVFYQVWQNPLMTLNREHLVSDVIALCGGSNVFGDLRQLVPQLSNEAVVVANPEVMLSARERSGDADGFKRDPDNPAFVPWARYPRLTAVRRGWLYTLAGDHISRQGPRIVQGARAMCEALDQVRSERRNTR